jgi:hypothetical protein
LHAAASCPQKNKESKDDKPCSAAHGHQIQSTYLPKLSGTVSSAYCPFPTHSRSTSQDEVLRVYQHLSVSNVSIFRLAMSAFLWFLYLQHAIHLGDLISNTSGKKTCLRMFENF